MIFSFNVITPTHFTICSCAMHLVRPNTNWNLSPSSGFSETSSNRRKLTGTVVTFAGISNANAMRRAAGTYFKPTRHGMQNTRSFGY